MAFFEADFTLFLFEKELHCGHLYKLLLSIFQKNKTNNNNNKYFLFYYHNLSMLFHPFFLPSFFLGTQKEMFNRLSMLLTSPVYTVYLRLMAMSLRNAF